MLLHNVQPHLQNSSAKSPA